MLGTTSDRLTPTLCSSSHSSHGPGCHARADSSVGCDLCCAPPSGVRRRRNEYRDGDRRGLYGRALAPVWQPATPAPVVTAGLITQAGYGLTKANTNIGTVDEVIGAVPATVHLTPSAKTLSDQYARFGRCMAEHMGIHDQGHELALLVGYNRKNRAAQAAWKSRRRPPKDSL